MTTEPAARALAGPARRSPTAPSSLVQPTAMAPAVTIDCAFDAGSLFDPPDLPGVGQLVGRVLDRGHPAAAGRRDCRGARRARRRAARHHHASPPLGVVHLPDAKTFPTCSRSCSTSRGVRRFPSREIEQPRGETITALRQDEDNPGGPGGRRGGGAALRRGSPVRPESQGHDRVASSASVEPISSRSTTAGSVPPASASPSSATSIADAAIALAAAELEDWSAPAAEHVPVAAPVRSRRPARQPMSSCPESRRPTSRTGSTPSAGSIPGYYAYWMMNNVLGQFGLGGRLADNIRERQGMAYYVVQHLRREHRRRAAADSRRGRSGERRARDRGNRRGSARAGADGPTPAEVSETCEYLVGSIPRLLETNHGIAAFLQTSEQLRARPRLRPAPAGPAAGGDPGRDSRGGRGRPRTLTSRPLASLDLARLPPPDDARGVLRRRLHPDPSRAALPGNRLPRLLRPLRHRRGRRPAFDAAVAAASSTLDAGGGLYDPDIFIRYTRRIIEEMGGRGDALDDAARDIYDEWSVCHHFTLYEDVPDVAAHDPRRRRQDRADLEHAAVPVVVPDPFRARRACSRWPCRPPTTAT